MTYLPITLTIAAAVTIINLWLAVRTVQVRIARKVMNGAGGDPLLETRMRAQSNLIEYAPLFLILLGLIEAARGSPAWLWGIGIGFVIGRLLHPFGLERPAPNPLRAIGILLTFVGLLALSAVALGTVYRLF